VDSNSIFGKYRVKLAETVPPYLGSTIDDCPNMDDDLQRKILSKRFADLSTKAKSQERRESARCGFKIDP
jgi:hypothetical protein